MKYIQKYERFNTVSNKDLEQLNEGWKEWLAGGLIALSSIAGVYKLNKDSVEKSKESRKIEQAYSDKLSKALDGMDKEDVKDLPEVWNQTGGANPDGIGNDMDLHYYPFAKDTESTPKWAREDYSDTLSSVKELVKKHPYFFGVTKDGKVIVLDTPGQDTPRDIKKGW